jgi:putative endonuclease
MGHNAELGRLGESIAAEHFEKIGYSVLARNWRCRHGEIDLIVGRGDHIVAVEVKTRSNERFGHPFEAITPAKRVRMYRLAQLW